VDGGDEITEEQGDALAQDAPPPRVGIYAAAAGLATAVPVPFVDRALSGLARGAALRRVAKRRGIRLSRGARDVLSGGRISRDPKGRWLRSAIASALAPVRVASRVDDAVSTWAAALLLDHHLVVADRPRRAPLTREEALRIRRAMDSAEVDAVLDSLRLAPRAVLDAIAGAVRSAIELDVEDRSPLERAVDSLLDAAAEAPDSIIDRLKQAFDYAMKEDAK